MFVGKLVASSLPKSTNIRAYDEAVRSDSLQTIFSETYKTAVLRTIIKHIPLNQKITLHMTEERWLLMSIHEYRGSIQVAQLPNISDTSPAPSSGSSSSSNSNTGPSE